jgi:CBS domain-containing protein
MIEAPASLVMRRRWIATSPGTTLLEAAQLMRLARVRHLPVAEDGVLLGLIDHGDVLRASLDEIRALTPQGRPVAEVMDRHPPSVLPDESVLSVAARMLAAGLACIPVVALPPPAEPRLVGLVVEGDLLRRVYGVRSSPAS